MEGSKKTKKLLALLLLCAVCIGFNLLGARVAQWLSLPLYLDCIGIVVAAAVGGLIPGVIVGFFTNIIIGIFDPISIYYCFTSVLIGLCAAAFCRRNWLRRFPHILLAALSLALIGGGIGSVLTWRLFNGGIGEGVSSPLAVSIYEKGVFSAFLSQLIADFLLDIVDKAIVVAVSALIVRLLPDSVYDHFAFLRLASDESAGLRSSRVRRVSLRAKVILLISAAAIIVTAAVTVISLRLYHTAVIDEESQMAMGVAHAVEAAFDPDRVEEYMTLGEEAPGYLESEGRMAAIAASSEDIAYVYVYQILPDGCHVVFDPDTSEETGADPGELIPFDHAFMPLVPDLLAGRDIDPVVSDETYGWLLSVYLPVRNSAGDCCCYVGVDILMQRLQANENIFLTKVASLFLSFFLMVLCGGAWAAERVIIRPINDMARVTGDFASHIEGNRNKSLKKIQALKIDTGDEIENLYHAIRINAEDTVHYIADVQHKNEQISHLQNGLIMVLADLVESRDKCTGNHVRNTAIYVQLIMNRMKEKGMYPGLLTDAYMADVINSAPLHDVGKIHIPDALLNKPGRLTDEEFGEMKSHTTVGGQIIDRAIDMMPEESAGYMTEAKNLTMYHHERWDGKGYPQGLRGEEIPLSARIMAVADVFDALVARRSYKEPFPFEKAIAIIREEAGTHFDPTVVEVFLECQEEAKKIAREANEKNAKDY